MITLSLYNVYEVIDDHGDGDDCDNKDDHEDKHCSIPSWRLRSIRRFLFSVNVHRTCMLLLRLNAMFS